MCGLVSVFSKKGNLSYPNVTVFKQMLFADTLRGNDATGMFTVNKYGNLSMAKAAVNAQTFLSRDTIKTLCNDYFKNDVIAMVGHNRSATKGDSTKDEFAHPFIEGNTCLVHNGTLHTHKELGHQTVDSHAICHAINTVGYKEALPKINGAFALIWYEADTKEIKFTRNSQRPLWKLETSDLIVLASEYELAAWILARNDEPKWTYEEVPINKVFSYNVDTQEISEEDFPKKVHLPAVYLPNRRKNLSKNIGQTTGNFSKNDIEYLEYSLGDIIEFTVRGFNSIQHTKNYKVFGESEDNTLIETTVDKKWGTFLLDNIGDTTLKMRGIVSLIYTKNGQLQKYVVKDAVILDKEPKVFVSENDVLVTETQLTLQGGCCTQCGGFIEVTSDEDIQHSYVKIKKGKIATLICGDCLEVIRESIPNYGKGKKYAAKKSNFNSVFTRKQVSEESEDITPIESIRASISC